MSLLRKAYQNKRFKAIALNLLFCGISWAGIAQESDKSIFEATIQKKYNSEQGQRVIEIAQSFLGKPYVANTLESKKENLVVNLREFDCSTLVESVLAISLCKNNSFEEFKHNLETLRYRFGHVNGYGSRLHYFTDWLKENERKGLIKDQTQICAGKPYKKSVSFMTSHLPLYPQLEDYRALEAVKMAEIELIRKSFFYIPKAEVAKRESCIQNGDIIAITTSKSGLDISHQGFAIVVNGRVHLLHASQDLKEVIISPEPLAEYLAKHASQTGIMISRLVKK
ncbi:N-acetylmuramoyl-L-alanine amidase-like domain-containing protein [Cellulophaga sp. BC115SP]|uniref:N-acetylmuramoyl-L-alanine amidase-like domain-containing protein n=1 Tax=Cellulophaga sp. BC115SP TaxID=2683263 RepID=UPI0014132DC2|nr:DUF1460 domain-containing protein [Cellulophaga sp. BC115SP]